MTYEGKLYGKIGRRYVPLKMTSQEVDQLIRENTELRTAAEAAHTALVELVNLGSLELPHRRKPALLEAEKAIAALAKLQPSTAP